MYATDFHYRKGEAKEPFFAVYTANGCSYCDNAMALIHSNFPGARVEVRQIDVVPEFLADFKEHGWRTVPQILMDGEHIGGHDDLVTYLKLKTRTDIE